MSRMSTTWNFMWTVSYGTRKGLRSTVFSLARIRATRRVWERGNTIEAESTIH